MPFVLRSVVVALSAFSLTSCASMSDRPTDEIIASIRQKERKVVRIAVPGTVEETIARLEQKAGACTPATIRSSGSMPSGSGGLVTVTSTIRQRLERGTTAAGETWLALRMDSVLHMVAFAVAIRQVDAATLEVSAFPADARKPDAIRQSVESGTLFCDWRDFSYPYD